MESEERAALIRPALAEDEIQYRDSQDRSRSKKLKKALHTLHTLELMAVNIYRYQITGKRDELNRHLISAMVNEMTHLQDFQQKLFEYGWRPQRLRWAYWLVGLGFGIFSRALGDAARLRMGIWVETRAVHHYNEMLEEVEWDDQTRRLIEKNRDDESLHINRWKKLLSEI
jgi:ubiquinone biosynthesis monooxygenase Coq7